MIEDDDVTVVAAAPEASPVAASAPPSPGPDVFPPKERKRRPTLWPVLPEEWGPRDDQRVFRAVERLLGKVPPHARRRVRTYIMDAFSQTTIEERVATNGSVGTYPPSASAR